MHDQRMLLALFALTGLIRIFINFIRLDNPDRGQVKFRILLQRQLVIMLEDRTADDRIDRVPFDQPGLARLGHLHGRLFLEPDAVYKIDIVHRSLHQLEIDQLPLIVYGNCRVQQNMGNTLLIRCRQDF
ncbi:hypothetical protein D3C75_836490 [compost metagenome]